MALGMRVGRAAFKNGSIPRAVDMPPHSPHALRHSTFRAPGWGAPVLPSSCCRWRSVTPRGLALFRHRSTSRIFIRQPGCSPPPAVTQDDDRRPCGGEKQAGLRPLPHPQLQGCSSSSLWRRASRARVLPPAWLASCFFLQHSGERALTGLAEGANFDNAGSVGRKRRQLQRAWLAGSAGSGAASDAASCRLIRALLSVHRTGGCRAVRTGDRPRRRTSHGWRSCSWIVLSSLWHDASVRRSAPAHLGGREWGSAGAGWGDCHLPVRCQWAGGRYRRC
jgi:hypothetical protein